ncbi:hypothetical protein Tco_0752642 [Tanacetum coccineum]|uniref:Uncharacterized protein n=1 Tax=Tanacetum coccineum TaxID=301880 RepID=A0ABQ4ZA24_9ASTR
MLATGRYVTMAIMILTIHATNTKCRDSYEYDSENSSHFEAEKEAIHLILTGIVNELRAKRMAKNANPLALVATAQTFKYLITNIKTSQIICTTSKASLPSRSHATTRHKGKEIAKPITPSSELASEEDRLHFLNFFNDPRIIREQRIAAYKGYRGGGVVQVRMSYLRDSILKVVGVVFGVFWCSRLGDGQQGHHVSSNFGHGKVEQNNKQQGLKLDDQGFQIEKDSDELEYPQELFSAVDLLFLQYLVRWPILLQT